MKTLDYSKLVQTKLEAKLIFDLLNTSRAVDIGCIKLGMTNEQFDRLRDRFSMIEIKISKGNVLL